MKPEMNRRQFIKTLGFAAGTIMLGGCAEQIHPQASLEAAALLYYLQIRFI